MGQENSTDKISTFRGNDAAGNSHLMEENVWDEIQHLTPLRTKLGVPPIKDLIRSFPRVVESLKSGVPSLER